MTLLFAYYADDFTGATDTLETLAHVGIRARLYTKIPTSDMIGGEINAIGIASTARSLPISKLAARLTADFSQLLDIKVTYFQYKICSTFDSSLYIGNIAVPIEIWRELSGQKWIPIVAGTPRLGRYCAFGNLFARIGKSEEVYRLDRHPVMSHHPVTPMTASDVGEILKMQGLNQEVNYITVLDLSRNLIDIIDKIKDRINSVTVFDAIDDTHLEIIGKLLIDSIEQFNLTPPVFLVGPSGATSALCYGWLHQKQISGASILSYYIEPAYPLLVLCGSCSSVSKRQRDIALRNGFVGLYLDPEKFLDDGMQKVVSDITESAIRSLREGKSVVIYSCDMPNQQIEVKGIPEQLGEAFAQITNNILRTVPIKRLVTMGGDTTGRIVQSLEATWMEPYAVLSEGVPICRIKSNRREIDGLEICCKSGQLGTEDILIIARDGRGVA